VNRPVLVVDDEEDMRGTYERLLRRLGYRIVPAGSCQGALALVRAEPLALVITDLRLPDGDGLAVVRTARALPDPPPVVVVTGYPSEDRRRAALDAGARAFLGKPFGAAAFTELVRDVLEFRPADRA